LGPVQESRRKVELLEAMVGALRERLQREEGRNAALEGEANGAATTYHVATGLGEKLKRGTAGVLHGAVRLIQVGNPGQTCDPLAWRCIPGG
jgi:hypothetical protein